MSFDSVESFFEFYSDVFNFDNFKSVSKHETHHHIATVSPSFAAKIRQLSPEKLEFFCAELNQLIQFCVLHRHESDWLALYTLYRRKIEVEELPRILDNSIDRRSQTAIVFLSWQISSAI